jgi:hypothetical protein
MRASSALTCFTSLFAGSFGAHLAVNGAASAVSSPSLRSPPRLHPPPGLQSHLQTTASPDGRPLHRISVDYNIGRFLHLELRIPQIDAGRLQRIEDQPGRLVIHAPGPEHLDHLHQRHLHRVRVFKYRQIKPELCRSIGRNLRLLPPDAFMKIAKPPAPQRR